MLLLIIFGKLNKIQLMLIPNFDEVNFEIYINKFT